MTEYEDFTLWRAEAYPIWDATAPAYVQADMQPLVGHLRQIFALGATPADFKEALELAFHNQAVTKRRALFYAYGILRNRFGGDDA